MFNNHEDIIKIVEEAVFEAYSEGLHYGSLSSAQDASSNVMVKVQQRLEYMQSQIDELQLEYRRCRDKNCRYCPEEMSQEQIDNWAKNQKVVINPKYIDKLLQPKVCYGRHVISNASDDIEEFVNTNHNELWIDGIRFELSK